MVAYTWLAGRVDLASGKLRYVDPRFQPCASAYAYGLTGGQKLIHTVQYIEVHDAHCLEATPFGQPSQ